ncbi:hypothetical protein [Roseburia sp. 1XD42-69]|uniref:hypothetical protein n=1 Tax=Roseburia sp. 1XD42-69 TaxID=2320088 RepID=UPI000EA340F4|nr:hypothetical protein [Roseburia sp. 1XD42-69]RKJ65515.1 hypothetical protein D7Y06_09720 [Roseburia sp. 1XD42-69]
MIVLKTNRELDMTFDRLIKTMGVPVEWTKHFVVIGDYLILQGRVRSLFFNFESKKVITNVVDIPITEDVVQIEDGNKVCNVLNLVLYAFGKWGVIHGIKVEKDYAQVNALFESVLREIHVEPGYTRENFRFYRDNLRINYEDVVQIALESTEEKIEDEGEEEEASQGLWHNLVWKKRMSSFIKTETTFEERQAGRLGNNFYMVGYQCPICRENLHMVVFPEGKEFKIETEEGRVLLARAYTCEHCHCFYTPRPKKLLIEGDVYDMEFLNDLRAYGDYVELLGNHGDRVSNYNFNEFESERGQNSSGEGKAAIENLCDSIEDLSREELFRLENMIEEGFYPGESVKALESTVLRASSTRKGNPLPREEKHPVKESPKKPEGSGEKEISAGTGEKRGVVWEEKEDVEEVKIPKEPQQVNPPEEEKEEIPYETKATPGEQAAAKRRYDAKFGVLDRLSIPQMKELRSQLEKETKLSWEDRKDYLDRITKKEQEKKLNHIRQRAIEGQSSSNYGQIMKIIKELEGEELPLDLKEELLTPLYQRRKTQAETEVAKLMANMPKTLERAGYEKLKKKLSGYPEADLSVYEEKLMAAREQAEGNEIASMMRHARTGSRQDLSDLAERLQSRGFAEELIAPHLEKINARIRQMDEEAIDKICGNPMSLTEEEAKQAIEKIKNGMFLPELKTHALEMLNKRLVKIKTDECELLVSKLQFAMTEKMRQNPRHHFYPARKVMMQECTKEELSEIQYALDTYGTNRGIFEYPILVVDTSRNESGKEGMILTPEHLFYHTMMNAYDIPIWDIKGLKTSTGLLNSGIFVELKNGTKAKIPYAVERSELKAWGVILRDFIRYLQEKPDSRNVSYLAKDKHETICCFRCGYTYKGGNICPKCGYKMNQ